MFRHGWKRFKAKFAPPVKFRLVAKDEAHEMFTRTIEIVDLASAIPSNKFKAILDAGCHAGDLVTSDVVLALQCMEKVQPCNEVIGMCLNGNGLKSIGTIVLRWEGVGFYKIFETRFHVVEGDSLPWQIVLGAETCAAHSLLTVGAFGGSKRQIFTGKGKKHHAEDATRMNRHKEDVVRNAERVEKDKNDRKAAKDQQEGGRGGHGSAATNSCA